MTLVMNLNVLMTEPETNVHSACERMTIISYKLLNDWKEKTNSSCIRLFQMMQPRK